MSTCMESCENDAYMLLNLVAEVGEYAGKMAKLIRKGKAYMGESQFLLLDVKNDTLLDDAEERAYIEELKNEAGDIMWQIAGLCSIMNWDLEDVCQANIAKLASRKERGVIEGEGDNR